jgi:hypothetical protein
MYEKFRRVGGGFGQVYVGRRVSGGSDRVGLDAIEVLLRHSISLLSDEILITLIFTGINNLSFVLLLDNFIR